MHGFFLMDGELNDELYDALLSFPEGITVPTNDSLWNNLGNILL